jgi:F-type H+-transporting ATPase subunit a
LKLLLIIAGSLVAVLAVVFVGYLVASGPEPHIVIPPEKLWKVGPLYITSTLMGAWLAMAVIIIVAVFATRSMKLIPGGLQNFIEGFIDFLVTQCEEIAGKEYGRKFFTVVATFFIFILVANWIALLPIYKTIGITKDYGHEIFEDIEKQAAKGVPFEDGKHYLAWRMDDVGGWGMALPGAETFKFDIHDGWTAGEALDAYIVALADHFTDFEPETPEGSIPSAADVNGAIAALAADTNAPVFLGGAATAAAAAGACCGGNLAFTAIQSQGVESAALGAVFTGVDFPGQKVALVYPFFRATYSDVNNTLALALVAFITVWVWGFQAQGFGYLGKFFVAPWKSPIMTFVGLLELISEFIRIISWSMRLFGNIFAGSVLLLIMAFLVPFIAPIAIYGLELFVGLIQAIVFALLVLVFGLGAVESHHDDDHDDDHHEAHDEAHHDAETEGAATAPQQPGAVQAH